MIDWALFTFSTLIGLSIITSYIIVFGNVGNAFTIRNNVYSYVDSPYWFGISSSNIYAIIMLQVLAAIGYIAWFIWLCTETNFGTSILRFRAVRSLTMLGFLLGSVAWPYTAYYYMISPSFFRAICTCLCLWVAAFSVIFLVAGTFEADPPFYATLGILFLGNVVVLADGIGWSARCIQHSIY